MDGCCELPHEIKRALQLCILGANEELMYNLHQFLRNSSVGSYMLCPTTSMRVEAQEFKHTFIGALERAYPDWFYSLSADNFFVYLAKESIDLGSMSLHHTHNRARAGSDSLDDPDDYRPHFMHSRADIAAILGKLHARLTELEKRRAGSG